MRMVTIHGGKQYAGSAGLQLRLEASRSFLARAETARTNRQSVRLPHAPERQSIQRAMLLVEHRLVEALWVLARLPNDRGIGYARRNGVGYIPDGIDNYAAAVEGRLESPPPKPSPPSARAIDAMHEPLDWLRLLPRDLARLLTVGAQSKRGDVSRNINWARMRNSFPELADCSTRSLQRRYQDALRTIVAEISVARLSPLAHMCV